MSVDELPARNDVAHPSIVGTPTGAPSCGHLGRRDRLRLISNGGCVSGAVGQTLGLLSPSISALPQGALHGALHPQALADAESSSTGLQETRPELRQIVWIAIGGEGTKLTGSEG